MNHRSSSFRKICARFTDDLKPPFDREAMVNWVINPSVLTDQPARFEQVVASTGIEGQDVTLRLAA